MMWAFVLITLMAAFMSAIYIHQKMHPEDSFEYRFNKAFLKAKCCSKNRTVGPGLSGIERLENESSLFFQIMTKIILMSENVALKKQNYFQPITSPDEFDLVLQTIVDVKAQAYAKRRALK